MRRNRYILLGLMIVLVLSKVPNAECNGTNNIGEVHFLDVGGVDPPTIGWMIAENATATGMTWDGVYTGQTESTWSYTSWIKDSDGVDTVFYQYKFGNSEWENRTPTLIEGNSTRGRYSYTMTQSIWWDWEANTVQVEGGLRVSFRIFANDSLGNWRTTVPTFQNGYWLGITPPSPYWNTNTIPYIVAFSTAIVVLIVVVILRKRHGAAQ